MEDPLLDPEPKGYTYTTRESLKNFYRQISVISKLESIICDKVKRIIAAVVRDSQQAISILSDHRKRILAALYSSILLPPCPEKNTLLKDYVIQCELMSLNKVLTSISEFFSVDFFSTICTIPSFSFPEPEKLISIRASITKDTDLTQKNYCINDRLKFLSLRYGVDIWHRGKVTCLSCYGNRMISCGKDGFILIWDLDQYSILKQIKAHDSVIKALCISKSGLIYSGDLNGVVKIINIENGIEIDRKLLDSSISSICLNHNENIALVGTKAGILKMWNANNSDILSFRPPSPGLFGNSIEKSEILSICVSNDDKLAMCRCFQGNILIWDLTELAFKANLSTGSFITSLIVIPASNLCASSTNEGKIHIWDPTTGRETKKLSICCNNVAVTCIDIIPERKILISGGSDLIINIWSLENYDHLFSLKAHTARISVLQVLNNDYFVAADDSGAIIKWCLTTKAGEILKGHSMSVSLITSTSEGNKLVSCSDDGIIKVNSLLGEGTEELVGHRGEVKFVQLNPDTGLVYSAGDDGCVRVWNPQTGGQVVRANKHMNGNAEEAIDKMKISGSGNIIFSRSTPSKTILIYDLIGMCKEIEISSEADTELALMKYPEIREFLQCSIYGG